MRLIVSLLVAVCSIGIVRPAFGTDRFADDASTLDLPSPLLLSPSPVAFESRYWIVSSRNCPQQAHRVGCCALDVMSVASSPCATETCQPISLNLAVPSPVGADALRHSLVPGVPVCVLVHGSYVSWDDARLESEETYRWLQQATPDRAIQFIAFTWPSDPLTLLANVDANILGKRSGINGFYLAQMMHMIPPECPVCFVGHSHGTRAVASMLHLLQGGVVEGYCLPAGSDAGHRIRAVFVASAIDHDWLNPGKRYGNALGRLDGLLNIRNRRDWVLGFYPLRTIGSSRALGRTGWTRRDYSRLGMQADRLQELDVTAVIGKSHVWPTYYETPALAAAIGPFVHFSDDPVIEPRSSRSESAGFATERLANSASAAESPHSLLDSRTHFLTAR